MPGPTEILIVAGVIMVLFGAAAIPKFARSIGRAKREFERGVQEGELSSEKPEIEQTADK